MQFKEISANPRALSTLVQQLRDAINQLANLPSVQNVKISAHSTQIAPANNSVKYAVLELDKEGKTSLQQKAIEAIVKSKGLQCMQLSDNVLFVGQYTEAEKEFFNVLSELKDKHQFQPATAAEPKPKKGKKETKEEPQDAEQ